MVHDELSKANELLIQTALDALCRYQDARNAFAPAKEIERLRQKYEAQMKILEEFQHKIHGL
ncbi:hypothetical protein [Pseudomonas rubra]|uniref:Uncharacterized protein n=1 Tax=Pseudomonas rubra TaxID=2942627 RepID=A0ABT5P7Q4_9PSED|nr:hypothetical protein [Pseudomonas rubra]MDD1014196.1 hypothetical protein [Pseudomonas rubra]MDD1041560.1 hypothetical protein [Pseudomonas rubra]MDD1156337.1 hypothetical protein [Pseudomonas rubra]